MPIKLANNASGTLATAISASDTGVALTTGNGALFPALSAGEYFYATLTSTAGTQEIIKATARSGDSLTVVRAQEGTSAQSFAAGARFELRVTAGSVEDYVEQYAELGVYTPAGTNAVATTIRAKLAEIVSVEDFGATSGADTAAINAAITYAVNNGAIINFDFDATIRVPTDAPTIQKAIDAINAEPNVDITINIEAGHILTAGFRIDNRDCSYMTISSTDAVVTCSPSFALMSISDLSFGLRSAKNMFVAVQARMPRWNILVDASGVDANYGIMLMQGSYGYVYPNKGITNLSSTTIQSVGAVAAYASQINAYGANFSNNQNGIQATVGSIANCAAANFTNCSAAGLDVSRSSIGYCNDATISGGLRAIYARRSWVTCQGATISGVTGLGIYADVASHVVGFGVKFQNMTGVLARVGAGSTIDLTSATEDNLPIDPNRIEPERRFNQLSGSGSITDQVRAQGHAPQITAQSTISVDAQGEASVAAQTFLTILDTTGARQIVGGSVVGSDVGIRITVDGVVKLNDTGRARGFDSAGEYYAAISIPPCASTSSLKIEVYNRNTSATTQIGWRVYRSQ